MKRLISSDKIFWQLVFPAGLLFAVMAQLLANSCGLGLTYDSYLFLEGGSFFRGELAGNMVDQAVFQSKPPIFSLVIAWLPTYALPYFFTILLMLSLFLLAKAITLTISSSFWQSIAFLAIATFTPLVMVHVYLWTEPLFLVLLYTVVLILIRSLEKGISDRNMLFLVFLGILMVLTRHVGLFFILGIFIAMCSLPQLGWKKGLVILIPAVFAFLIWNFGLMSEGMEGRMTTFKSPVSGGTWARLKNFEYFIGAATTWLLPNSIPKLMRILVIILVILPGLYLLRNTLLSSPTAKLLAIVTLTYYLLLHAGFLIDESSADRYLAPIYPLVLIMLIQLVESSTFGRVHWLKYLVVLWLLYPVSRTVKNSFFWKEKICAESAANSTLSQGENCSLNQAG